MSKALRRLSLLTAALVAAVSFTSAAPVDAHSWEAAGKPSPYAWCLWRTAEWFPNYNYDAARMIHYGDAHVYQCGIYNTFYPPGSQGYWICFQQVEWYGWGALDWWYPGHTGPGCPV